MLMSAPPHQASADAVSVLFASAGEGHMGDTFWLSASGLLPNTQYNLYVACPNWFDPTVYADQNLEFISPGPMTDSNGRFVRVKLHALQLHHKSGSLCHIYSQFPGENGLGPDIPATFTIVPRSERLPQCVVQICGSVSTSPRPARAGRVETFLIKSGGWGGAFANVTIDFNSPGAKPIQKSISLHWDGTYSLSVRLPPQATHVTTASVSATFHLGHVTGKAHPVVFTVVQ
jgi:hypothetical protein